MKFTGITVSDSFHDGTSARSARLADGPLMAALLIAFKPFGSLTEGVDGKELASAILAWFESPAERAATAGRIWSSVASATTDQMSAVLLKAHGVVITTPTSGTEIMVSRSPGKVTLSVDFGPNGSESRAWTILEGMILHSEEGRGWMPYEARLVAGGTLSHEAALRGIVERLERTEAWIDSDSCTWNQDSKRIRQEEVGKQLRILRLRQDSLD